MSTPETVQDRPQALLAVAVSAVGIIAPLLALVGAFVYVLLLTWYSAFYGRFGVEPSDAGLGQVQVLTQAAAAALPLLAAGYLIAGSRLVSGPLPEAPPIWRWPIPQAVLLVTVLATLFVSVVPLLRGLTVLTAGAGLMWLGSFGMDRLRKREPRALSPLRRRTVIVLYIASLLLVGTSFALLADGTRAAEQAAAGREPGGVARLLSVQTPLVTVVQADGKRPAWSSTTSFRLLGRNGTQLALYDAGRREAVLVPAAGLVVRRPTDR